MKTSLIVNEIFGPTIQGEGLSKEKRVIFLRLTGCNLACSWCDTPYTWNWLGIKFQHPEKYNKALESHRMSIEEVESRIIALGSSVKALVVSGGEPLLQMTKLEILLHNLRNQNWWIEIETNGTILPSQFLMASVSQINCSPKLISSGIDNPTHKRIKERALRALSQSSKVNFKFVIASESDIHEVVDLQKRFNLRNVILMPEGKTKKEQIERTEYVSQMASQNGFIFSPRLHVLEYGNKRGV